jgi:hypothetical protein
MHASDGAAILNPVGPAKVTVPYFAWPHDYPLPINVKVNFIMSNDGNMDRAIPIAQV